MILYRNPTECPNRDTLATMTKEEAATWAARASTQCMEVSRLAEVETYFGLARSELYDLHRAAVDKMLSSFIWAEGA